MPFSDNPFTNSWLENTYSESESESVFANVDFDSFDAAIGLSDPALNQWGASYMQQPLLDSYAYSSPISECDDFFGQIAIPSTEQVVSTQQNTRKRSSSPEFEDMPAATAPKAKRGRPRASRAANSSASSSSGKSNSVRTPHNQVERKYRESLNTEMERLRLAVPSTARWEDNVYSQAGKTKPSKAMVLASAISYIHSLEKDMEQLKRENGSLIQVR